MVEKNKDKIFEILIDEEQFISQPVFSVQDVLYILQDILIRSDLDHAMKEKLLDNFVDTMCFFYRSRKWLRGKEDALKTEMRKWDKDENVFDSAARAVFKAYAKDVAKEEK